MPAAIVRDLNALHSAMNSKVTRTNDWIAAANRVLARRGLRVRVTETVRSAMRQLELWHMGRNRNGQIIDLRKVVTRTQDSLHEYRLALDWVPARVDAKGKVLEVFYVDEIYDEVFAAVPPSQYGLERLTWESPHLQIAGGYNTAKRLGIRANQPDA